MLPRLQSECATPQSFAEPEVHKNFLDPQLFEPIAGTPEQLTEFLDAEAQKFSTLIREAGIKGE